MNTSTFMDKQIMDLSQQRGDDFINLMNHPQDEDNLAGNGITKEEMVPSYDFQPIRPIIGVSSSSQSPKTDASSIPSRDWHSTETSRVNTTSAPIRRYASLESTEPAKVTSENDQVVIGSKIIAEIDRTMKKHVDNLICVLEGVSARLTQLESRTRHLENSVDDLTVSIGNNQGNIDGRMRQLENIVRETVAIEFASVLLRYKMHPKSITNKLATCLEAKARKGYHKVQSGIEDVKDKQEIMESKLQIEIAKLQVSKVDQQSESKRAVHTDSVQQAISPVIPPQPVAPLAPPNAPPQPPQQNLPPSVQLLNQFPQNQIPSGPPRDPYFPPPGQTPEVANPQYQVSQNQQPHPAPSASPHQPYQPSPRPQYPHQQPQPASTQISHQHAPSVNSPQYQSQHAEEVPYVPSQNYPPSLHQPPSQPPTGPSPAQQFYGAPNVLYEPPSGRTSSGFSSGYSGPSGPNEPYQYGGSHSSYGSGTSAIKPQQFSSAISATQSGGGGYQQLPTARILPPALPTASEVGSGAGSSGSGNRVPIDDVVDKVTHMGFPRDVVRATVRRLTENGQSVDLNVVLDRLMNEGEGQPPRGWFGR